jgi:hypothetical protein
MDKTHLDTAGGILCSARGLIWLAGLEDPARFSIALFDFEVFQLLVSMPSPDFPPRSVAARYSTSSRASFHSDFQVALQTVDFCLCILQSPAKQSTPTRPRNENLPLVVQPCSPQFKRIKCNAANRQAMQHRRQEKSIDCFVSVHALQHLFLRGIRACSKGSERISTGKPFCSQIYDYA